MNTVPGYFRLFFITILLNVNAFASRAQYASHRVSVWRWYARKVTCVRPLFTINLFLHTFGSQAQYTSVEHRPLNSNEIEVNQPGNYIGEGRTFKLTHNIRSVTSVLFLGKDVTLDLNGYTIVFADGDYEHIPNAEFEKGLEGWDISEAPGAEVVDALSTHVFIGNKLLSLQKGDIIRSSYINLPLAGRSYFAMCGVTGRYSHNLGTKYKDNLVVSLYVEDTSGREVNCITQYRDSLLVSCPAENVSPRLGGGFVYAHLNHLPAGKYRIKIKAVTDCLIGEVDIRPAMDVGIGIVEKTDPLGSYDDAYNFRHCAFFDYTTDPKRSEPVAGIPRVHGRGTVIIKNGIIRSATPGIMSWGIQSTADSVEVILENVKIINAGINATAVDVPWAIIDHCTFDVDDPFLIQRHGAEAYAVDITGDLASEVEGSEFYGGQGCLMFRGKHSSVHNNYFVNRQTVTNHYSIMAMGDGTKIFDNRIEPETGSGIEIYVHRDIDIFNNHIKISTSPPTCEYGDEEYSTDAVRIADYNAKPGSENGCYGNRVFSNTIEITGKDYSLPQNYIPMAWAVFYSTSGGDNEIFGNDITVNDLNPESKTETAAFYIGGGTIGGKFYNNRITTNVPAAWIACRYGNASNTEISRNLIIRAQGADSMLKPFRMGWQNETVAKNIQFKSNEIRGMDFGIDITKQPHTYKVWWTLDISVRDRTGEPVPDAPVEIYDKDGKKFITGITDATGHFKPELKEYDYNAGIKNFASPYEVRCGRQKDKVALIKNSELEIILRNIKAGKKPVRK